MTLRNEQLEMWRTIRCRLNHLRLLAHGSKCISTRVPGTTLFWYGSSGEETPTLMDVLEINDALSVLAHHAVIYRARPDVTAIASGCGTCGLHLLRTFSDLPIAFSDQARHLGGLRANSDSIEINRGAMTDSSNVLSTGTDLMVLGMTGRRLMLNAELFELCASEYTLSVAAGKPLKALPWISRYLAKRRLMKDEQRAAKRLMLGLLPFETYG